MKNIKIILLTAVLLSTLHTTLFAFEADDLYRNGQYSEAIAQYESVLASGLTSPELYYNLGNAYYRDNQLGRAILNYSRALRLRPTMTDARENLALAESKTVDHIVTLPQLFVVRWYNSICTALSPTAWRIIWLTVFAILAAVFVTFRLARNYNLRKWTFVSCFAVLLLLLCVSAFWHTSAFRFNSHREAVVMQSSVAIKSSPERQSVDKLILHEGTTVRIDEELSGWYKITIADGTNGWCESNAIERI